MANVESDSIYIYPICNRVKLDNDSNYWKRYSSLNSEVNISNIIQNNTDKNFIIQDFKMDTNKTNIIEGECLIKGYFLKIMNEIKLSELGSATSIYIVIYHNSQKDSVFNHDTQLINSESIASDNTYYFKGCELLYNTPTKSNVLGYLKILELKDDNWVTPVQSTLKYFVNKVQVTEDDGNITSLDVYLNNYTIDDGRYEDESGTPVTSKTKQSKLKINKN